MNIISKVGESPVFVTAMAHCWFAFSMLALMAHWHIPFPVSTVVLIVLAGIKEFYIDLHYETNPPQTVLDSLQDFLEYCAAIPLFYFLFIL